MIGWGNNWENSVYTPQKWVFVFIPCRILFILKLQKDAYTRVLDFQGAYRQIMTTVFLKVVYANPRRSFPHYFFSSFSHLITLNQSSYTKSFEIFEGIYANILFIFIGLCVQFIYLVIF